MQLIGSGRQPNQFLQFLFKMTSLITYLIIALFLMAEPLAVFINYWVGGEGGGGVIQNNWHNLDSKRRILKFVCFGCKWSIGVWEWQTRNQFSFFIFIGKVGGNRIIQTILPRDDVQYNFFLLFVEFQWKESGGDRAACNFYLSLEVGGI